VTEIPPLIIFDTPVNNPEILINGNIYRPFPAFGSVNRKLFIIKDPLMIGYNIGNSSGSLFMIDSSPGIP